MNCEVFHTCTIFDLCCLFISVVLFCFCCSAGSSGNMYKWSKGAQIRGNLDILEGWLQDHGLVDQLQFLSHISMAVNLLATPKLQLMQVCSPLCA